ncbi:amidohydrolase [Acidaminobacter hydrogenoformans]|uniref:Amidohydrolase 3 domain-containing protein n=1 Tax=Acidaminobacter hydrogenoformans DSM 2784 TaxID=1120920 RepID=A0A1G5S3B8_9FIRM|nr:amidohydrolase [Acidaminobacter hydrogenoformans]SCZ80049.1 hypothetical protein SAMN03080599_02077 [Acidaminobacter hydrogenoformans DSM 2784]
MTKDLLIHNARCLTMVETRVYDWVHILGDKINDLGNGDDYKKHITKTTVQIDAQGGSVLPGFIDSHFHVVQAALNALSLDLSEVTSFEEIGKLVKEKNRANPGKAIHGIQLDRNRLREKAFPDRNVLDKLCNDVPLLIDSIDYQVSMLNTYALLYYKIPFTLEGIHFDQKKMPTGVITHFANARLRENILNDIPSTLRVKAVENFLKCVLKNGITTIHAMEGGRLYSDKDADFIYEYADHFDIDLVLYYQTMDVQKVVSLGLKRIAGGMYLDGTFNARTAALFHDYTDAPGNRGSLNVTQEELNQFVLECYQNRLQLALYAVGGRAIEQAITAHEFASHKTGVLGLRHRLEHVELPSEEQIKRAKNLGIIFSMSPSYESIWGGQGKMYEARLGQRCLITNPFREITDQEVLICGGSDCDVTPADPIQGIHAAVNHPVKRHRLNVYEAIKLFTTNAAFAIFEESRKGTIEIGKLADLVILSQDIIRCSEAQIKDIRVRNTIKKGRVVFSAEGQDKC